MPSVSLERRAVSDAYSNPEWKLKVKKMRDSQVHAIYMRLKQQNVIK